MLMLWQHCVTQSC